MCFKTELDNFVEYIKTAKPDISHATVDVTERYARKKLKVKKKDPIVYRGLALSCRGSKKWRYEQDRQQRE